MSSTDRLVSAVLLTIIALGGLLAVLGLAGVVLSAFGVLH